MWNDKNSKKAKTLNIFCVPQTWYIRVSYAKFFVSFVFALLILIFISPPAVPTLLFSILLVFPPHKYKCKPIKQRKRQSTVVLQSSSFEWFLNNKSHFGQCKTVLRTQFKCCVDYMNENKLAINVNYFCVFILRVLSLFCFHSLIICFNCFLQYIAIFSAWTYFIYIF